MSDELRYFEDFVPGDVTRHPGTHEVTADEIVSIGTKWDPQPFHTDAALADESIFGGLVASSVHLFAIGVRLAFEGEDGRETAAESALGFEAVKMLQPVRPGDRLVLRTEVVDKRPSKSRPGVGVLRTRSDLHNQDGQVVFTYTSASLIRMRAAAGPS